MYIHWPGLVLHMTSGVGIQDIQAQRAQRSFWIALEDKFH
jgi:hypothetical protein